MSNDREHRFPLPPHASAGEVHAQLAEKGLDVVGVSIDDASGELVIEGDDPAAHMDDIIVALEDKATRVQADRDLIDAFAASDRPVGLVELNDVVRSLLRLREEKE